MRRNEAVVAEAAGHPDSRYLLLWNLNVLTIADPGGPQLGWLNQGDIDRLGYRSAADPAWPAMAAWRTSPSTFPPWVIPCTS